MPVGDNVHGLVERWITVWRHTRGIDMTMVDGWPLIHVGSRTRETELICIDPGTEAFASLFAHVDGDDRAMLTVIAADATPYRSVALPPGVRIDRDDETLMVTTLEPVDAPPLEAGLAARWDFCDQHLTYAVESGERVAASGTMGILGDDATFDAVETTPAFQRRGLGRHVMATLTTYALQHGARTGVLAATAQGRRLYESIGWRPAYEMLSLMGSTPQR